MMSLEAYQDYVINLLVNVHNFTEQKVLEMLGNDPIIPHCHMNGRDPAKVAASLASKWTRWNQA